VVAAHWVWLGLLMLSALVSLLPAWPRRVGSVAIR